MSKIVKKYMDASTSSNLGAFSRYKNLFKLVNSDNETYIETPTRFVIDEDVTDTFFEVGKGYENRLDLISYKYYSTTMLWWVIAEINGIDNPLLVEAGTILRIPLMSRLYGIGGILS